MLMYTSMITSLQYFSYTDAINVRRITETIVNLSSIKRKYELTVTEKIQRFDRYETSFYVFGQYSEKGYIRRNVSDHTVYFITVFT